MFLTATLLGIVEGLTEYIPVSSTGHLILAGKWLGFTGERAEAFEVFIQIGAILAVLGAFPGRFRALARPGRGGLSGLRGLWLLALTTLPGLALGKLAHSTIKEKLFNPATVAMGLAAGAVLMLAAEAMVARARKPRLTSADSMTWKKALGIGCFQCLALWPGMSRSSSTLVGGMLLGFTREAAAEYSFLAAVPIVSAAAVYDLYKSWHLLSAGDLGFFAWGCAVSFFCAWLAIKFLLRFLASHSLAVFAYYRLGVAAAAWAFLR